MSEVVQAAALASIGPTLIGVAAVVQSTLAKREAAGANRAVNHQGEDQPTLAERNSKIERIVTGMADEMKTLAEGHDEFNRGLTDCAVAIGEVGRKVDRHLAFHQEQQEQHNTERAADERRRDG